MPRDVFLLSLGRALADLGVGAAVGFALAENPADHPVPAVLTVAAATLGLGLGARLAEKKGRRARVAGQLLSLSALGAALVPRSALLGLPACAAAAAVASVLLLRERADRTKERPRITGTILGLGGGAAIAHASPLGPLRTALALAVLVFAGAFAAMGAALFVGPGRPPPRASEVLVFLGLGAGTVAALSTT